jgi:Flagellar hook-length control protein FliK
LRAAVAQVLAHQTGLDDNLTGADIQQALQKSGLFLEASLAAGTTPAGSVPDLKAALIVLRQALATVAGNAESPAATQSVISGQTAGAAKPTATPASPALVPSLPTDGEALDVRLPLTRPGIAQSVMAQQTAAGTSSGLLLANALSNGPQSVASAIALSVLQEALPGIRRAAGDASVTTANEAQGEGIATRLTTPPPFRGAPPSAQPIAAPSIAPDAPLGSIAHRLLDDTDAAIARQTLLQVASLPDRTDASGNPVDASTPRWNFEIPFATPQGTAMAQFEIARDGGGRDNEAAQRIWQARFSLDVEPAGPVHALITLSGERTSVRMWAERPATAAQLRAGANELSQALSAAELQPGDIVIRDGAPPQPTPAKRGHFLDRAS